MYSNEQVQQSRQVNVLVAIIKLVVSASILYSVCLVIPQAVQFIEGLQQQEAEQLKVRVIANSSSAYDQQMKMQVVEEIQAVVNNTVRVEQDEVFFREVIHKVQNKFPNEDISVQVGDNLLPPKYQFAHFYPQNNYYSAVFIIGEGRGENWFCAAFPTVCRISDQENEEPNTFFFSDWFIEKNEAKL